MLQVTEKAKEKLSSIYNNFILEGKNIAGFLIDIKNKGCSGKAYELLEVYQTLPDKPLLVEPNFKLWVAPKAVMFIIGTTMDFEDLKTSTGFVFNNPNAKGMCGCGESFYV